MRYSRLLEENSYSNNRADYLCLIGFNALILMASHSSPPAKILSTSNLHSSPGTFPIPTLPFLVLITRILVSLHLGPPKSVHANEHFWRHHVSLFCRLTAPSISLCNYSVSAQYLPFCLIGFSWMMSGIKAETMGDAVRTPSHAPPCHSTHPECPSTNRSDLSRDICITQFKTPGQGR